jgi:hypothetical protein
MPHPFGQQVERNVFADGVDAVAVAESFGAFMRPVLDLGRVHHVQYPPPGRDATPRPERPGLVGEDSRQVSRACRILYGALCRVYECHSSAQHRAISKLARRGNGREAATTCNRNLKM